MMPHTHEVDIDGFSAGTSISAVAVKPVFENDFMDQGTVTTKEEDICGGQEYTVDGNPIKTEDQNSMIDI